MKNAIFLYRWETNIFDIDNWKQKKTKKILSLGSAYLYDFLKDGRIEDFYGI